MHSPYVLKSSHPTNQTNQTKLNQSKNINIQIHTMHVFTYYKHIIRVSNQDSKQTIASPLMLL